MTTATAQDAATLFEAERDRLFAIAYRMLGSVADAEDVVQETFIRWHAAAHDEIASPVAWLTTVCTRLAVDSLRAAYRKREHYVGPWLPEPIVSLGDSVAPDDDVELAESLSMAFLLLLERLSPLERAAFLLHDIFGYGYADVADVLGRGQAACRQLVSRARRRLEGAAPRRFTAEPDRVARLLNRFLAAARAGEVDELEAMLAADVEVWSDSAGEVTAARNVVRGANNVARFVAGIGRKHGHGRSRPTLVNGQPGMVFERGDAPVGLLSLALNENGLISRIFLVLSPTKLRNVR